MYKFIKNLSYALCTLSILFSSFAIKSAEADMKELIGEITNMYLSSMTYIFKNQPLINQKDGDKQQLFGINFINNIKVVYKENYHKDFPKEEQAYEFTYWHNFLFNPHLSPDVTVLGFEPDWSDSSADPTSF